MYDIRREVGRILENFIDKARAPHESRVDIRKDVHKMIDSCARNYNICVVAGGSTPYEFYESVRKKLAKA